MVFCSFLLTFSVIQEIISILALASKWLLRDAIDVSGSYTAAILVINGV